MIIGSAISSISGAILALVQDQLHHKQEFQKMDKELELEIKRKEAGLAEKKIELEISQQDTLRETEITKQNGINTEQKWIDAVSSQNKQIEATESRLVNFTNFYISTTRPTITYLLLLTLCYCAIHFALHPMEFIALNEPHLSFLECLLYLLESCISYWFVRRSSEKSCLPSIKKKTS